MNAAASVMDVDASGNAAQAEVRDLQQRLFGRKSEQRKYSEALTQTEAQVPGAGRPRGQRRGAPGHGRMDKYPGEHVVRPLVIGRKGFYESGANSTTSSTLPRSG